MAVGGDLHGPDGQLLRLVPGSQSWRTAAHGRLFIGADLGELDRYVPKRHQRWASDYRGGV